MTTYLIIGAIVLLVLWLIGTYNGLVTLRNRVEEAWSDITIQLKRRYDLIPNLVETVKGYAKHESKVFEEVSKARAAAMGAKTPERKGDAENALTETLKTILSVAEAYPELKASENFKGLQDELTDTENKIQASRRFYNGNVRDFNIKLEVFPTNLFARMLGFVTREFFELDEAEMAKAKEPVKVDFSDTTDAADKK
jgi:LemA protein